MELKFYYCEDCQNLVIMLKNSGVPIVCCGQKMIELVPGMAEASHEKHIPVYQITGDRIEVSIGEAEHPMTEEHFIEWIVLQTGQGWRYMKLDPDMPPKAFFAHHKEDEVKAVYAYCNLHGLWKAK